MQVRNKIFPYPVINNNKIYSNFKDLSFELIYEPEENDYAYVLKNARFQTESETIKKLFNDGKLGIVVVIECSDTVYRKAFEVSEEPKNLILSKNDFTEKVDVSMFAYAKEDFKYSSTELEEDYLDTDFDIEKYDILGAYDGFNVRFKHDETEDNLVQSIFSINVNHDLEDGEYIVECDVGRKISITLSENDYKNYKVIYTVPVYKEVFFNMLLVPALIEGLSLCKSMLEDTSKDLDDVGNHYMWFRSIQSAYKKLEGLELTLDGFKGMSPAQLGQKLLGKPLGESLKKLVSETNKVVEEEA